MSLFNKIRKNRMNQKDLKTTNKNLLQQSAKSMKMKQTSATKCSNSEATVRDE